MMLDKKVRKTCEGFPDFWEVFPFKLFCHLHAEQILIVPDEELSLREGDRSPVSAAEHSSVAAFGL